MAACEKPNKNFDPSKIGCSGPGTPCSTSHKREAKRSEDPKRTLSAQRAGAVSLGHPGSHKPSDQPLFLKIGTDPDDPVVGLGLPYGYAYAFVRERPDRETVGKEALICPVRSPTQGQP